MSHVIALLLGMFVVPGVLLRLGHHLRRQSLTARRMFWGGIVGWCGAVLLMVVASVLPPVLWTEGAREVAVYWSLLVGGLAGMGVGALRRPG
ncbi:MAG: hypothetical protein WEB88_03990 [Gemmatimonadota bacterium]